MSWYRMTGVPSGGGKTTKINLILEGAKEDTITITDKNGATVGVCVFPTGSTVGEVEIDIIDGQPYTFTSSIATGLDGTGNYSKTVTLYADGRHNTSDIGMVPVMTSNTTPSGEAFANTSSSSSVAPYKAFRGTIEYTSAWEGTNKVGDYIGYRFINSVCVKRFDILNTQFSGFKIQGYDGTNWVDIDSYDSMPYGVNSCLVNNDIYYSSYRILVTDKGTSTAYNNVLYLQFYSKGIKAMPEGALYWYGNTKETLGGWTSTTPHTGKTGSATINNNTIYVTGTWWWALSQNAVDITSYNKINALIYSSATATGAGGNVCLTKGNTATDISYCSPSKYPSTKPELASLAIAGKTGNYNVAVQVANNGTNTTHAIWLE